VLLLQATSLLLRQNTLLSTDVFVQVTDNPGTSVQPGWLAVVKTSSSSRCAVWHVTISLSSPAQYLASHYIDAKRRSFFFFFFPFHVPMCNLMCCQGCVHLQGVLQRLASATQPFDFRSRCDDPEVAQHVAEATVNTGTHEQLLRAAVAAIVRPSSRLVCHPPQGCTVYLVLCLFLWSMLERLGLAWLVLSCLVLSCLVLSCLVLSCLVLSCLVLSCLVLSCLVLSCPVLSCPVLSWNWNWNWNWFVTQRHEQ